LALIVAAGCASSFTAPLEVVFARRLGASAGMLALYIATPGLALMTVDFFGTRLVPRLDARHALAVAVALFGISELALGLSTSVPELFLGRILQGLASGLLLGSSLQGAVRVGHSPEYALGKYNGAFMIGSVLGGPAGGLIASVQAGTAGYRLSFFVCAAISIVTSVTMYWSLPPLPPSGPVRTPRLSFPDLGAISGVRTALVLGTFGDLLRGSVVYTALPLTGQERHISKAIVGLAVGVLCAADVLAMMSAVRVFERLGLRRCLLAALTAGVALSLCLAFSEDVVTFLLGALGFGIVIGTLALAPQLLLMSLHGDASKGLASYRIASGFGTMTGSTAGGALAATAGAMVTFLGIAGVIAGGVTIVICTGVREAYPAAADA